jgi:predicted nucleic acid-binding protein
MSATFIDTCHFLALPFTNDALNKRALGWQRVLRGSFVTTDFVLLEVADGACEVNLRKAAQAIVNFARAEKSMTVVPLDRRWMELGYKLFCQHQDKDWGLTDCISFQVMREMGITDALTHDHHFEQAGFRALLRHDPPSN